MTINIAPLNVAKQIGLPGLDIKNDASLMDFSAPSFSPVLSAFYDLIDGKVREIFLYGDSGVGKTHLLSALQRQYLSMPTNKTSMCVWRICMCWWICWGQWWQWLLGL